MQARVSRSRSSCELRGAAVVEQDDVEGLRAVAWRDAGPEGVVGVHALAGGGAGQKLQEDFEVLERGDDFFDADESDEDVGHGDAHAAVAFGLDDADGAGFGDGEVGAADADLDAQEAVAEVVAGGGGEVFRCVGELRQVHRAAEDFGDLEAVLVERGDDDVRGLVVAHLHDHVGEIGLDGDDAGGFERDVHLDFVGGHGLDLDDFGVTPAAVLRE